MVKMQQHPKTLKGLNKNHAVYHGFHPMVINIKALRAYGLS